MPSINYDTCSKIEFTEDDISEVAADNRQRGKVDTKVIATLSTDQLPGNVATPETITKFAELARVLGYPVSAGYGSLNVSRPYTEDEQRNAASESLKYGYSPLAIKLRDQRAAEQGIQVYQPEN